MAGSSNKFKQFLLIHMRKIIVVIAIAIHLVVLLSISINNGQKQKRVDNTLFKLVDIKEYRPAPPIEKVKNQQEVTKRDNATENVLETEDKVVETDIDYLPQHKISKIPILPTRQIKSRIVYPPLANKQGIEGIVYLELYIDKKGTIRKIKVLKDPGYGFADAAIKALEGLQCTPAMANGKTVAVRFRYPIHFILKH